MCILRHPIIVCTQVRDADADIAGAGGPQLVPSLSTRWKDVGMKNLKLGKQIGLGFALLLALLAGSIGFSAYQQNQLATFTEKQYRHPFTVTNAVARADANISNMMGAVKDVLLTEDAQEQRTFITQIEALEKQVLEDLALGRERFLGDKSDFDALIVAVNDWKSTRDRTIELKQQGKIAEAVQLMRTTGTAKRARINELRKKVYDFALNKAEALQKNAVSVRDFALILTLGIGLAAIVVGLVVATVIARSISRPIGEAVRIARAVAQGDLSIAIHADGESETAQLLHALKDMQGSLTQVVSNVRQGSESVATASAQIAQGNQDLSARTENQASSLQETAASMEQLGTTVRHNAENARQANQLAQGASAVAARGGAVVGQVVTTMKAINDSSKQIAEIISVIDGIAFQTNILALNAAVEAARAGEQGRGFAVVASEVRSLAQRSADAARQIKSLISASVERVEHGATLVDQAGTTMDEVVAAIKRVSDIVGEISSASAEQSAGVAQVGQSVTQMDQTTQQNAALVEEGAAAAESLRQQAQQLVEAVAVFSLGPPRGAPV
jgi:methyl-accepting chemotaxis protein